MDSRQYVGNLVDAGGPGDVGTGVLGGECERYVLAKCPCPSDLRLPEK
jgi:hypothetical protein